MSPEYCENAFRTSRIFPECYERSLGTFSPIFFSIVFRNGDSKTVRALSNILANGAPTDRRRVHARQTLASVVGAKFHNKIFVST